MAETNDRRFYLIASIQILIVSVFFYTLVTPRPWGIILGFVYFYFALISFLCAFKDKEEVQSLLSIIEGPLMVLIGLLQKEAARQIITTAMVLVLFSIPFLFGSILAFQALQNHPEFAWAAIYGLIVLLSIWFSSERFEKLFNRFRVEPLAEYKCGRFRLVIEAFYFLSIVTSTVLALVTNVSVLGFVIQYVALPAFITYIAWQRLCRAYYEIRGRASANHEKNLKQRSFGCTYPLSSAGIRRRRICEVSRFSHRGIA